MLVAIVWRLDEKWHQASLHFCDHVDDRVSIRSSNIDTVLSDEVDLVSSVVDVFLSEVVQVERAISLPEGLHDLPKDALLTLVIDIALILEDLGFLPIDSAVSHITNLRNTS